MGTMAKIVFASGVWNAVLGATLLSPAACAAIGLRIPHPFWGMLVCGFLWYTAVALILASRDLRQRGAFVYWEGILRVFAAALLFTVGPGVLGWPSWALGATDLAWGTAYLVGLPRALGVGHVRLAMDNLEPRPPRAPN